MLTCIAEGLGAARFMRYVAGKATDIRGETSTHTAGFLNLTLRQPFGVCAAITPWNAPITMLCFKIGGALIAGNTLVAKSSEKAPLTSLLLGSFIKQAGFPPGVVNILSGLGPVCGHALASHMHIRKLSFTGSLGAGRAIKRAAANSNMKNITLELGGKSPLIIFDDADLQKAAEESARSVLLNSGQACIASSRVYVHHAVVEEFNQHLVQAIQELGANPDIWSDPLDSGTRRGPQANEKQFKYIMGHLQEAKDNGAKFLTGGDKEGDRGFFIAPTVVTGVAESSRIMREEVFGPVVCVSSFSKEDEVVKKANDSPYGLYASVYTRDLDRAIRIATAFESGTVGVNCTSPMMTHDMPFGGFKESGEGKELGIHGVNQWTELKSIYIAVSAS